MKDVFVDHISLHRFNKKIDRVKPALEVTSIKQSPVNGLEPLFIGHMSYKTNCSLTS